mmetsp:Transcript_47202/g.150661  ORF Transcript_47202/g.150661 Transcript_47202/m.150661 type:complete len:248 (+) Transcript_47202:61-804(+)
MGPHRKSQSTNSSYSMTPLRLVSASSKSLSTTSVVKRGSSFFNNVSNSSRSMVPLPSTSHLRKASMIASVGSGDSTSSRPAPLAARSMHFARPSQRPTCAPTTSKTVSYSLAKPTRAPAFRRLPSRTASSMELSIRVAISEPTSAIRSERASRSCTSGQSAAIVLRHPNTMMGFVPVSFSSSALATSRRAPMTTTASRSQSCASPDAASRTAHLVATPRKAQQRPDLLRVLLRHSLLAGLSHAALHH